MFKSHLIGHTTFFTLIAIIVVVSYPIAEPIAKEIKSISNFRDM